jgi:uncharacterized alpha-E superfamily protein
MLSRVANNLYWMARYIERAENTARLINVNTHLLLDLPRRVRLGWAPIVQITGDEAEFHAHFQEADERSVIRYMVASPHNPNSLLGALASARENARTCRDFIPREAWEQINGLYLWIRIENQRAYAHRTRFNFLSDVILGAQTVTGLLAGTMAHDEGYDFLRIGRNLERADMTSRLIDVRSASLLPDMEGESTPFENIQWMSVLKSLSAYQMYRRVMRTRVGRPDVLRFLFRERSFPRSFYHAVCEAETSLLHLPRNERPLQTLQTLKRKVSLARPDTMSQDELHLFIDELQIGLKDVGDHIGATYF